MVRLVANYIAAVALASVFQFHYGTIGSELPYRKSLIVK